MNTPTIQAAGSRSQARVMITGAGGFIGRELVRAFAEAGFAVRAADRAGADLAFASWYGAETVLCELNDPPSLASAVVGADIVVHAAAIFDFGVDAPTLMRVNVEGTQTLCAACERFGVRRLVLLSSVGVYGAPRRTPCRESDPKAPRNAYERSKWAQERAAMRWHRQSELAVTALRPTLVYGPRGRYGLAMLVAIAALQARKGARFRPGIDGGAGAHFVHVRDVARACLLLATHPDAVGRAFNCVDHTPLPLGEVVDLINETLGAPTNFYWEGAFGVALANLLWAAPVSGLLSLLNHDLAKTWKRLVRVDGLVDALRPRLDRDWIGYSRSDNVYSAEALAALGFQWQYPDFRAGFAETILWYRDQRWIPRGATPALQGSAPR